MSRRTFKKQIREKGLSRIIQALKTDIYFKFILKYDNN